MDDDEEMKLLNLLNLLQRVYEMMREQPANDGHDDLYEEVEEILRVKGMIRP